MVTLGNGGRPRLPRRRALGPRPAAGAEDAPAGPADCSRAASGSPGARRRSPRAASSRCRNGCTRRASCWQATAPGFVNVPALKGIHYAIETGAARGRGRLRGAPAREAVAAPGCARVLRRGGQRRASSGASSRRVRNMRQAFGRGFWLGGALAGAMTASQGQVPARRRGHGARRRRRSCSAPTGPAATRRPTASSPSTSSRRSSLSGQQDARRRSPNHIRVQTEVPPELAELWAHMCPAQVYEPAGDGEARRGHALRTASSAERSPRRAAG